MPVFSGVLRSWCKAWPVASVISRASAITSKLGLASSPPKHAVTSRDLVDASLEVLQQRNRQLLATLSTIPWPKLVSFRLNAKTYTLPLRSTEVGEADLFKITPQELEYFAGFFDGDGCVRANKMGRSCSLAVAQSIDGIAVLLHLRRAFGGSIYRFRDGKGLSKPMLTWILYGSGARRAATLLAPHSIVKRKQLEIASELHSIFAGELDGSRELRLLKRSDSGVARACTWAYFAGFLMLKDTLHNNEHGHLSA